MVFMKFRLQVQHRNFVLVFFSFDTCMTTMPIDNHPLTQRRLQFIGIGVNKLNNNIFPQLSKR